MLWARLMMIVALVGLPPAAANEPAPADAEAPQEGRHPDRILVKLLQVRTLYVEPLQGEGSAAIRDMLIASLHKTGLFVMTEDPESADAVLRGSGEDLIYQDVESRRAGLNARGAASNSRRESGESRFNSASFGVSDTESTQNRERRHEALAAVRILLPNGEIIWSTTQESKGAKYRGSAHDVAEKVADDLLRAYRRAEKMN